MIEIKLITTENLGKNKPVAGVTLNDDKNDIAIKLVSTLEDGHKEDDVVQVLQDQAIQDYLELINNKEK